MIEEEQKERSDQDQGREKEKRHKQILPSNCSWKTGTTPSKDHMRLHLTVILLKASMLNPLLWFKPLGKTATQFLLPSPGKDGEEN